MANFLASPSKRSTHYTARDVEALAARGTAYLNTAASEVKQANGRFAEENLEILRAAWKLARQAALATSPIAALPVVSTQAHRCLECGQARGHRADCCMF